MTDPPCIALNEDERVELEKAVRLALEFGDEAAVANQFGVSVRALTLALTGQMVSESDYKRLVQSKANMPSSDSDPTGGDARKAAPSLSASEMADALVSGLSGPALARVLHEHFPKISRADAFAACALAASIYNADVMILELALAEARRRLAEGLPS